MKFRSEDRAWLNREQALFLDTIQHFVAESVMPYAQQWDREGQLPATLLAELGRLGVLGAMAPVAYGGSGQNTLMNVLLMEALAYGSGAVALTVAAHTGLCLAHLQAFGNEAQKAQYLPGLIAGSLRGAWALTEPDSGSDAAAMNTSAVLSGDSYRISGQKMFITQGNMADVIVVLAKTDASQGKRGITAFCVEAPCAGLSRSALKHKLGMRASDTAVLTFDGVCVPKSACLGEWNAGFQNTLHILEKGRLGIAALSLGLAAAAYDASVKYVQERVQFGRPLSALQTVQFRIADMFTRLSAARIMVRDVARRLDAGLSVGAYIAAAKVFATEVAVEIAGEAVQLHGGYGYLDDFPVERILRDAKLCTIGEGTSEIQRLVLSRQLLSSP